MKAPTRRGDRLVALPIARTLLVCLAVVVLCGCGDGGGGGSPAPPAPLFASGLYTGLTSQTTGCANPVHPDPACEARFNIAASLDELSPSPQVTAILTRNPCANGNPALVFTARCGAGTINDVVCRAIPITQGQWTVDLLFAPGVFTMITAGCAGQRCQGSYNTTNTTGSCVTGPLTWSATATGSASAARAQEGASLLDGVKIEVDHRGDLFMLESP